MVNYKTVSAIFIVLAIIFGTSTGYLVAFPPSSSTLASTETVLVTSTASKVILTTVTGSGATTTITGSVLTTTTTATSTIAGSAITTTITGSGATTTITGSVITTTVTPPVSTTTSTVLISSTNTGASTTTSTTLVPPTTTSTSSTTSSSTSSGGSAGVVNVKVLYGAGSNSSSQGKSGFSPDTVVVVIGVNNTVKWTNDDSIAHTITSTSIPAGAQSFNDESLNPTYSFSVTFTVAGTYQYYCEIHPWMQGTVIVEA